VVSEAIAAADPLDAVALMHRTDGPRQEIILMDNDQTPGGAAPTKRSRRGQQIIVASAALLGIALFAAGVHAQGTLDKIEGTGQALTGSAKETLGKATGDTKLEWNGKADRVEGTAQNAVGDLKNMTGGVNDRAASLLTRLGDFLARIF
jgi:uncharacterized protein YjbJ (UPF0337 family)